MLGKIIGKEILTARQLEMMANMAIIIMAMAATVGIILNHFPKLRSRPKPVTIGMKFLLPDFQWEAREATLVFVLSTECKLCTDSASFYRQLLQIVDKNKFSIVAVFSKNTDEAKRYLKTIQVPISQVMQYSLPNLGVIGTPSIYLINREGIVINHWLGRLSMTQESEIIRRVTSRAELHLSIKTNEE